MDNRNVPNSGLFRLSVCVGEYMISDVNRFLAMPEFQVVDENELERDREYLMEMYPARARIIMVLVEDACDKLDYEGSPMYAMYPDRETILGISGQIYDKVRYNDTDYNLKHMIDVMLCNEFFVRRSRYKRRRKFF